MTFRIYRVLAWIAVCLIAVEVALEARAHARGWPTLIFGDDAPAAESEATSYGPTDTFPFRSRIYPPQKPDGVTRIWLGSSSYAEDVRQPPDKLFLSLAERRLRDAGHDVELFNSSEGGSSTVENIDSLFDEADAWNIDVAVLYQMTNDIDAMTQFVFGGSPGQPVVDGDFDSVFTRSRAASGRSAVERLPAAAVTTPPINDRIMSSVQRFFEKTSTYAQLKNQVTARLTRSRVLADRLGADGNALILERVEAFLDACEARGIEPVLCTFATSHVPSSLGDMPADSINNLFRYNIYLSVRGWMTSVEEINDGLRALAAERDIELIDVAASITNRPELFRDFTHLSTEGHAAVAEVFADGLTEVLAR